MTKKERVAADIERRIAERDRLWVNAQGSRPETGLDVIDNESIATENQRLAARVERLEHGLSRYLDPQWVAGASPEQLAAHAREVLRSRTGPTPPRGAKAIGRGERAKQVLPPASGEPADRHSR